MRFGLIGTGYWARKVHAPALTTAPDVEFAGVWGRDTGKAQDLTERFGGRTYERPADMFADVDAVSFAVPPQIQAPLAIEAANAGCHILMEKPISLDASAADDVARAVATNAVASIVFFTSRFVPATVDWLHEVRSTDGWVGGNVTWLSSIFYPGSPYNDSHWRQNWGALWDLGPHALSLLLPILGPAVGVTAVRGPGDTVHVILRHENGGSSTMSLSLTVPGQAAQRTISVYGSEARTSMPGDIEPDPVAALVAAIHALQDSARTGVAHACGVEFGREVVHVLARAQADLA